jgi:hypothetical protein
MAIRHKVVQVPPFKRLQGNGTVNLSHVTRQRTFPSTSDSTRPFFENDLGVEPTAAPYTSSFKKYFTRVIWCGGGGGVAP